MIKRKSDENTSYPGNEFHKRISDLTTFSKIFNVLRSSFDLNKLLHELIMIVTEEVSAEMGSIMLLEGDRLIVRATYGEDGFNRMGHKRVLGEGISGWVAEKAQALLIRDISKHKDFMHLYNPRYKSPQLLSAPIMLNNKIYGIININNKESGGQFNDDDLQLLLVLATSIALVIENFSLIAEIRIKERFSSIGEVVGKLAHEIRNPLNGIKMNAQILCKKVDDKSLDEYFNVILSEIARLDNLVKDILDFSKSDKLKKNKCAVNEIIEKALRLIISDGIEIERNYSENLPNIKADGSKLEQAFLNVLLNSVQAMEKSGLIRISTGVCTFSERHDLPKKKYIEINFMDTGPGIPANIGEKIFSPFYTTKVRGTGMGLPNTEFVIRQHGGKISFESEEGKGVTFRVLLPAE